MPPKRRSTCRSVAARMTDETSEVDTSTSNTSVQQDTPASSPPVEHVPEPSMEIDTETAVENVAVVTGPIMDEQKMLEREEARAKLTNEAQEARRVAALRKKKKELTQDERTRKAAELDELLKQSAAFSAILTKKTQVLGRVGTGLDGKALGEHDLQMAEQPKSMIGGTMRDYQLEGLTWMYEICAQGMSGILADEMGLGKTIQTIALIAHLREKENYLGPHLIIGPLSTLSNWMAEFKHWCPSIPVVLYHGLPEARQQMAKNSMFKHLKNGRPTDKFPVVCTSYEMVIRDKATLGKINWEFIIVDEGHRLKNFESKLFRELRLFRSATRLLITGTPLQNNLKELWALLNFLMPTIFKDWEAFESWFDFGDLADEEGTEEFLADRQKQELVKKMHLILQPMLLRRIKADVAAYLPKKREYLLYAPMTREQTDLYNVFNDKEFDTRAYLENKVVERLTRDKNGSVSSAVSTGTSSRATSISPKPEFGDPMELPIRVSPRKKKAVAAPEDSPAPAQGKTAFAKMMAASALNRGRGRPPKTKSSAVSAETTDVEMPVKGKGKRKRTSPPTLESPASHKSAKSSRQSTPATSTRRSTRATRIVRESEPEEDDLLSDDEFEAKLASEAAKDAARVTLDPAADMDPDELARSKTLELAKKEIRGKKLGNPMMQLRKICNSPHLFYSPWSSPEEVDETLVTSSGKMLLLDRLLPALFKRGHKVLIFSQFVDMLGLVEDYCTVLRGWETCRIVGDVAQSDRADAIAKFTSDPDVKIFLLSTRAGGQGINLASADTVILFDSDWNPQQDLQAQDRAHRIGQTRPVVVYRFATQGTVEDHLLMSAGAKRRLEKLVIKKGNYRSMVDRADELDAEALKRLLLKDGEVYRSSGHREILSDADIEAITDRSDQAYERAAVGEGGGQAFTVVETVAEGVHAVGAKSG